MKNILSIALLFALMLSACQSDDDGPFANGLIHYDGENNTAPNLDPGEYEAAARFPANMLADFAGKRIIEIDYFMGFRPAACEIKIYSGSSNDQPVDLLYSANVTNGISETSWNTHSITRDLPIANEDIWVSVAFRHDIRMQSIGCDFGPAQGDGDWLFQLNDNEWRTFLDRTTTESINWNIRMQLE